MDMREKIGTLADLCAPTGFEGPAAERIAALVRPMVDEVYTDTLGSVVAVKRCGVPGAKKLMLEAHLDEIGLIVTGYEKGFLRFSTLGGVDPRMLPALEVKILTDEPMYGVIDTMPPHALSDEDMEKAFDADKLFINVGLTEEEAVKRIPLGTPVSFASECFALGENRMCGKSFDDRACAAILLQTLENVQDCALDVDLCLLFAVQEEIGGRGAVAATFGIAPDYAVAVDVTHAHTPDAKKSETLLLGEGPAVAVGPNISPVMFRALRELSEKNGWPYQTEVIPGNSGTDGWEIQISREGVATAVVSLPLRYMHTPVEVIDLRDAEATARLLTALVKNAGEVL